MDFQALGATMSGETRTSSDRDQLIGNYDTFLRLLTSQLRNQNPLEPMDANQFTEQLVQYSTVEQQIKTNENLEGLMATMQASTAIGLVSYVGATVTARTDTTRLSGGSAQWSYVLDTAAPEAVITVRNANGAVVHSVQRDLNAGTHTYTWDGKLADGSNAPAGNYSIEFTRLTENGPQQLPVTTRMTGVVDAVDMSGGEPILQIGDTRIPLSRVISVGASS